MSAHNMVIISLDAFTMIFINANLQMITKRWKLI